MADREFNFEKNRHKSHRSRQSTQEDMDTLQARLQLDFRGPAGEFIELLQDLMITNHLAIEWYQQKIRKTKRAKDFYFGISLALLLFIPVVTYWLSGRFESEGAGVTSQITVVLTGLIGFQRGLSAWLDDRKAMVGFSKASSDLKKEYYAFEQRWENREVDSASKDEFEADVMSVIANSRAICDQEQDAYFQNLSYPSIDMGKILGSASSDASALAQRLAHPSVAKRQAEMEAGAAVERAEALVKHYEALASELQMEFDSKLAAGVGDSELASLRASILAVINKLRAAELDAAAARAAST